MGEGWDAACLLQHQLPSISPKAVNYVCYLSAHYFELEKPTGWAAKQKRSLIARQSPHPELGVCVASGQVAIFRFWMPKQFK